MPNSIRPRRLFVCGASRLSKNGALFVRELGGLLGSEENLVVITGGLEKRLDEPDAISSNRMVIEGMLETLNSRNESLEAHIETLAARGCGRNVGG